MPRGWLPHWPAQRPRRHHAAILTEEGGFICDLRKGLGSSLTGGEEVDIVATAWFRSAKPFAIDVTVSNPMLPQANTQLLV